MTLENDPFSPENMKKRMERLLRAGEYDAITTEILQSTPDNELDHMLSSYIRKRKIPADGKEYEEVAKLGPGLRMVYSTWMLEVEVPNGGFNQFFWNHDGRFLLMAREGFELISAARMARLMDRVANVRKLEADEVRPFEEAGTIEAFSRSYEVSALDELDKAYYTLNDETNSLRIRFIRENTSLFLG